MQDLSSLTRVLTCAPYIGSAESSPLNCQEILYSDIIIKQSINCCFFME